MLQLVLSRAGYGKTEYVFSSIKKLIETTDKSALLITPEQYSFVAEQRLLRDFGESNLSRAENTSFTRLARDVFSKYGGSKLPVLSNGAKAVKMKEAIEAVQDSLVLFGKNKATLSFINSIISVYDEMKSCRVSTDDILRASDNAEREILKRKLHDVSLIISAYDALINNEYYDPANELTRLYEKLCELTFFKDKVVYIDGFSGFVAQEYKIIEVILQQADEVYITFCTDSHLNTDKYDLFSYVNGNIQILRDVTKKANVRFLNPIYLNDKCRFKNRELAYAEKYVFANIKEKYNAPVESIRLFCAKNICDEADNVALNVSRLLRSGYRARDIAVICRDMDKYERELSFSFQKYNVPYFDDERQNISSQPLIMFVRFLFRIIIYSFRSEDVFSFLKTGLTELDNEKINELENYAFLWNVKGSQWKRPFTKSTRGFVEEISEDDRMQLASVNESREYVISNVLKFNKRIKNASVNEICKALYYLLKDFSVSKQLKKLAVSLDKNGKSALAEEQGRIWDMLIDILDMLSLVYGNKTVSISEFYKLLNLMIMNEDLGTLPMGLDNVQLGSADRIRCNNPKAVFVVGANEGEFPKSIVSSGIFSASDRASLIENDFKLYSYGEALTAQEKYFAYMALSAASEKLFVSYIGGNDTASPSIIVSGIKAVFPTLKEEHSPSQADFSCLESRGNAFEILASSYDCNSKFIKSLEEYFSNDAEYASRLNAIKALYKNDEIILSNSDVSSGLFGKDMYLSASRIEDYYNCSFRYFCKFGLNARPRLKAEMDPMQTGTVIHYILEQLLKEHGSKGLTALGDSEISVLVHHYLSDYLKNKMGDSEEFTARFKYQFLRLSRMLTYVVIRLRDEFLHSDFEAKAFELKIGNEQGENTVKSRRLVLPDGGSIEIKGAVDRVDLYEENGKKYVRVVDYKSGNKDFKLSDVLYGLNLQMLIYLFTLSKTESEYSGISSGVLYMHSSRSLLSLERGADRDAVKAEENKSFKMKGLVLNDNDNEIAKHMEHALDGKYIPVKYVKKSDSLSGNIVTLEELGRISSKIDELIVNMGVSLHNGEISQNPVNGSGHDKTCEFCDYNAVCLNRREISKREMKEFDNDKVKEILKEEQHALD